MDTLFRELRYAFRMLAKNPSSSIVAVVTMALGIGLTAAMFSIIDGILLRGLPFEESERLLHLERSNLSKEITSMEVTQHDFEDWRAQQQSFEGLAGFNSGGTINLADEGFPERYRGAWISANFLELLRVQPFLGRGFEVEDELPGAEKVVLLGYHVWQKRYGGDRQVIGQKVFANSEASTIVGVLPDGFRFPISEDVWMPLVLETAELQRGEGTTLEVFGRLRDGVTVEQAGREYAVITRRLAEQYPETNEGVAAVIKPYIDEFLGDGPPKMLAVMFGAVVLVLFIACFNVTRGTTSLRLGWLSKTLVVIQVAMSCALMVAAGLLVRSVLAAYSYDLRFDPENVLTARMGLFEGDHPEQSDWVAFYDELQRSLAANPEVVSTAVGTTVPTDTAIGAGGGRYERPDETYDQPRDMPFTRLTRVSPGYFDTYGLTILAGRDFTAADRADAPAVALVNEDFARKEWPGENPIGQRINLWQGAEAEEADPEAGWVEVVGVVPDLRFAEFDEADDQQGIYVPMAQDARRFSWIIVKTRTDPVKFSEPLRRAVLEIDPNLPLYFVRSMDQVLEQTMFFPKLFGTIFGIFGVVALLLACVGLYGVMAFGVTQRTQEMGVRMAFGARALDNMRLILKQGMRQVSVGLVLGLALGAGMGMALASFLYQVKPADPVTFSVIPVLLVGVSLLACLLPARRASAVDPIQALHYE